MARGGVVSDDIVYLSGRNRGRRSERVLSMAGDPNNSMRVAPFCPSPDNAKVMKSRIQDNYKQNASTPRRRHFAAAVTVLDGARAGRTAGRPANDRSRQVSRMTWTSAATAAMASRTRAKRASSA